MLAFIKGLLFSKAEGSVTIEASGLGYEVLIPANVYAELPELGSELFLHLSFVIRENSQTLYGFQDSDQKSLFQVLLAVSGIGPKTALQMVGNLTIDAFQEAVRRNNIALMCKVPGIGKKTAQRLILEIKDKLPTLSHRDSGSSSPESSNSNNSLTGDAMSALVNLGYTQAASQNALKQALNENSEPANLPALITAALQHI